MTVYKNLSLGSERALYAIKDAEVKNSVLDTKDAFWHSRGVTVKNSVIKGEYLA